MVDVTEQMVLGQTIPILSLVDRTTRRMRRTRFVFTRSIERVVWASLSKSNGTFSNLLARNSLQNSVYTVRKAAVMRDDDESDDDADADEGWLTLEEYNQIMHCFRQHCHDDFETRLKVRQASMIPIAACITALQCHGRDDRTTAWLKAFNSLPKLWQMRIEDEQDKSRGEVDLALKEDIDETAEVEYDFCTELVMDFVNWEAFEEDDAKISQLPAAKISPKLARELKELESFRTALLHHERYTSAVKPSTFVTEKAALLRFLNWYCGEYSIELPDLDILRRPDLGQRVQTYTESLTGRELRWSSICNYLSGIVQCIVFAHSTLEQAPSHSYDSVCNLRRQAEKFATQQQLYKRKVWHMPIILLSLLGRLTFPRPASQDESWIDWPDVQKTRVNICQAYLACEDPEKKRAMLRSVIIVLLHSVTPPDRVSQPHHITHIAPTPAPPPSSLTHHHRLSASQVGVIRKLKYGKSLRVEGGDFVIDTTKQGSHKTSKVSEPQPALLSLACNTPPVPCHSFMGLQALAASRTTEHAPRPPFGRDTALATWLAVTTVSKLVQPWLRLYIDALSLELAEKEGEFYLFHVSRNLEKNMSSSQWCSTVKAIFKEFSPTKVSPAPKNLRAR